MEGYGVGLYSIKRKVGKAGWSGGVDVEGIYDIWRETRG